MSLQDSHSLQGLDVIPVSQFNPLAKIRAQDVLPEPLGPQTSKHARFFGYQGLWSKSLLRGIAPQPLQMFVVCISIKRHIFIVDLSIIFLPSKYKQHHSVCTYCSTPCADA